MSSFYTKTKSGEFVPITFKEIATKDWENKLILVRIGSEENPTKESEVEEAIDGLEEADVLENIECTSFLVSTYNLDFEIMGSLSEISKKYIAVRVSSADDLSKLGPLQQKAKEQLRGKTKKTIVLPTPITVEEYAEVNDVLKRLKVRRQRRSK